MYILNSKIFQIQLELDLDNIQLKFGTGTDLDNIRLKFKLDGIQFKFEFNGIQFKFELNGDGRQDGWMGWLTWVEMPGNEPNILNNVILGS